MEENEMSFEQALERLQEIVKLVKSKDLDLEKSLDLLEEGVHLANFLTKKVDFSPRQEGVSE